MTHQRPRQGDADRPRAGRAGQPQDRQHGRDGASANAHRERRSAKAEAAPIKGIRHRGRVAGRGLLAAYSAIWAWITIVEGGQTMNPSIEDIARERGRAASRAKNVFVLPEQRQRHPRRVSRRRSFPSATSYVICRPRTSRWVMRRGARSSTAAASAGGEPRRHDRRRRARAWTGHDHHRRSAIRSVRGAKDDPRGRRHRPVTTAASRSVGDRAAGR